MDSDLPQSLPDIPDELIKALDRAFPDKCPEVTATMAEIYWAAGCASVVRFLKQVQEAQRVFLISQNSQSGSTARNPSTTRVVSR